MQRWGGLCVCVCACVCVCVCAHVCVHVWDRTVFSRGLGGSLRVRDRIVGAVRRDESGPGRLLVRLCNAAHTAFVSAALPAGQGAGAGVRGCLSLLARHQVHRLSSSAMALITSDRDGWVTFIFLTRAFVVEPVQVM